MKTKLFVVAIVVGITFAAVPAQADHDQVYSPCDAPTGYIYLSVEEVHERVDALIAQGAIDPDSLTITTAGLIISGTPSPLLIEAGVIQEYAIDHNGFARHYLDPYWEYRFNHLPNWTFWEVGCMGHPKAPLPHAPSSTTSAPSTTTSTSLPPTTTSPPPPTTTVVLPLPPPDNDPIPYENSEVDVWAPSYNLYDAEWDDWPFEITVRLLEERYVPNTPNRHHFPLSAAVDYLRNGGLIAGLDHLWEAP